MDTYFEYMNCFEFAKQCLTNGPCDMAMLGYVDNLMEMEILEEEIMEYGRS